MKKNRLYIAAFIIPLLAMAGICIAKGIYPFGKNSFMHCDMYHQYVPFLVEFWRKLHNGEGLAYAWSLGIGSDFTAIYGYYLATPTNWLVYFVPEHLIIEFMTLMILLKIAMCGFTFSYYLSKRFQSKSPMILGFSTLYAFSGFVAAYNWNHMWMDVIWLAPLVLLGLERLVKERKYALYTIALTASIFTNYYLSIMLCIFLVLYFLLLLFTSGLRWRAKGKAIVSFGVYSVLAGGMSAVLLIPVQMAMRVTEFHDISLPKKLTFYFNPLEMLARHCVNTPKEIGLDHWPNIYCGVMVFFLIPMFLFCGRIPLKQRIGKVILAAFMLLSFSTNILNFIWHGFNYPDSLPARQSFLYIFLILTMAYEVLQHYKDWKVVWTVISGICCVAILAACGILVTTDGFTVTVAALTWCFLVVGILLTLLYVKWKKRRLFILWIGITLLVGESIFNMYSTSVSVVQRAYYMNKWESYQTLLEETEAEKDFFRYNSFCAMSKNDGTLAGYPGISIFSSTTNSQVVDYYEKLGMEGGKVSYYPSGMTAFTAALLGVRYTFTEKEEESPLYTQIAQSGKMYLYKNNYTLPIGIVLNAETVQNLEQIINKGGNNPLKTQNEMAEILTGEELFDYICKGDQVKKSSKEEAEEEQKAVVKAKTREAGHYYAFVSGNPGDTLTVTVGEETIDFDGLKKNCILDLGAWEAETDLQISSTEKKKIDLSLYRVNSTVLEECIKQLGSQPFIVEEYRDGYVKGTVNVKEAGNLVLSIPSQTGWKILLDGEEIASATFAKVFTLLDVTAGEHTIRMEYRATGVGLGAGISAICISAFIILMIANKKKRTKKGGYKMGNIIVGQSGGPTAVINASVAGVYTEAKKAGVQKVYGMIYGIQGFLEDKILDLDEYLSDENGVELLKRTPSAFLGSCRFKMPKIEGNEEVYEKVFERMEQHDIDVLIYIGGNDSMDTVKMLSDYAAMKGKSQRFIGVPKTVDNDLPITDHCPGYGSAAKYIATSLKEIIRDNAVYGDYRTAVLVVEIMGRHAGWLTAAAALAKDNNCEGVDAIYLPEADFDMDKFLDKVKELATQKKSIVIAVSEGVKLADGRFVCELSGGDGKLDAFGHKQLSGCGVFLSDMISEKLGFKSRVIEFSTLQRAATHIASLADINEACMAGEAAVEAALAGKTGMMVTLDRKDNPYTCTTSVYDIHQIANVERTVPVEWITKDGCNMTEDFENYARPLIMGELSPMYENGTPKHLVRK